MRGIVVLFLLIFLSPILARAATCPNGTVVVSDINAATFVAAPNDQCTEPGYTKRFTFYNDGLIPIFNGATSGSAVTLCENGYLSGNTCVAFEQSNCQNGYYNDSAINSSSLSGAPNGVCVESGYPKRFTFNQDFSYPIFNGTTSGSVVTLCGGGAYLSGGTCTSYTQGDCPTNYVNVALSDTTFTTTNMGACATGYTQRNINQQCDTNTTDSVCAVLCGDGTKYTDAGTCATLCGLGANALKVKKTNGDILSFPLYSEKQTTPALGFGFAGGACYINLLSGRATDALNFKNGSTFYHTVK